MTAIASLPSVERCEPTAPRLGLVANLPADVAYLDVSTKEDIREQISRTLVEQGFGLLELSAATAELESVFVQLSRQTKATAAAARAASEGDA
jgi:hypothetical protein